MHKLIILVLVFVGVSFSTVQAQQVNSPVVVELFTAQGCSSCPKADAVLRELADQPNVIALACHVTYWDRLGWTDTLGRDVCTQRQGEYGDFFNRGNRVYTPQMIINGAVEFNGGNKEKAVAAIAGGGGQTVLPINITTQNDTGLSIQLPFLPVPPSNPARILVFAYQNQSDVAIRGGENRGKNIVYTHPVLAMDVVGTWEGAAQNIAFSPAETNAAGYAVIAQDVNSGRVLAAGKIER